MTAPRGAEARGAAARGAEAGEWLLGQVCVPTRGRDRGRACAVVGLAEGPAGALALVADGRRRRAGKPKRKSLSHLALTGARSEGLARALAAGALPTDRQVREALRGFGALVEIDAEGMAYVKR